MGVEIFGWGRGSTLYLVRLAVSDGGVPWITLPSRVVLNRELERQCVSRDVASFPGRIQGENADGALPRGKPWSTRLS